MTKLESFNFFIGQEKEELKVNLSLVSHHSKRLDVWIIGHIREPREGCAPLNDVDRSRLSNFANTSISEIVTRLSTPFCFMSRQQ